MSSRVVINYADTLRYVAHASYSQTSANVAARGVKSQDACTRRDIPTSASTGECGMCCRGVARPSASSTSA